MKRYFLVLFVLLVIGGVLGLPPRPYLETWWSGMPQRTPERQAFRELRDELLREDWLYQRIQWRDSVAGVFQRDRPPDGSWFISLPDESPDSVESHLRKGLRTHLEYMGFSEPRVPVGVFLFPRAMGSHPAARTEQFGMFWASREFFVARGGEAPFCALVEPVFLGPGYNGSANVVDRLVYLPRDGVSVPNTLRICGYYARYGVPGPRVETWLREGGAVHGSGADLLRRSLYARALGPLRRAFGRFNDLNSLPAVGMACLAGEEAECRHAFLGSREARTSYSFNNRSLAEVWDVSPVDFLTPRWWGRGYFGGFDQFIFESLEAEFGPQAFQAFWSSDLSVEDAFQAAFGVPVGVWIMEWAQGIWGVDDKGPGVPVRAALASLLTLGILGALGIYLGTRRGRS